MNSLITIALCTPFMLAVCIPALVALKIALFGETVGV